MFAPCLLHYLFASRQLEGAVCSECGDHLDPRAVEVRLGPALCSDPDALRRFRS